MALFAKTNSKITMTGKNIPIPFSETKASPDNVCDRYINIPNKKRFINMFKRPNTNCNWRFLNKNKVTIANMAEVKNNTGVTFSNIEAPENKSQQEKIPKVFNKKIPLLANMVEGGSTPIRDASELQALGYSIVIFPGGLIRAFTYMAIEYFESLKKHGSNKPFYSKMLDFGELNELLGTNDIIEIGKKYDPSSLTKNK